MQMMKKIKKEMVRMIFNLEGVDFKEGKGMSFVEGRNQKWFVAKSKRSSWLERKDTKPYNKLMEYLRSVHRIQQWYQNACCEALNKKNKQYILDLFLCDKMEAGTTSTTLTARLPILNPWEYDLWLIRIEQYFLMTDYSLWEVILKVNKVLKRTLEKVEHEYEPTSAEETSMKRNEIKLEELC
ncbi:hypothetical protein Tco_1553386 [Tanacetum coccineum]